MRSLLLLAAALERDHQRRAACVVVTKIAATKASSLPSWWAWSAWLAAGITCKRIANA